MGLKLDIKLKEAGLKVTPQRIAVLEAIHALNNHPSVEQIIEYIRNTYPNIGTGTVYNVLDVLVEKKIIRRVKTDKDKMRYDGMMKNHHHIYCTECDIIEDYMDEELDKILEDYFKNKKIKGFTIEEIKVQINGKLKKCNK